MWLKSSRQANAWALPRETLVSYPVHRHLPYLPQLSMGIHSCPSPEKWRSTHCFCIVPYFTHSKDDGEIKCFFCCKKLSVSGIQSLPKRMFSVPAQIIEELLDKEVLLIKWMVWKRSIGHQIERVKHSLNDTEEWPYLRGRHCRRNWNKVFPLILRTFYSTSSAP